MRTRECVFQHILVIINDLVLLYSCDVRYDNHDIKNYMSRWMCIFVDYIVLNCVWNQNAVNSNMGMIPDWNSYDTGIHYVFISMCKKYSIWNTQTLLLFWNYSPTSGKHYQHKLCGITNNKRNCMVSAKLNVYNDNMISRIKSTTSTTVHSRISNI